MSRSNLKSFGNDANRRALLAKVHIAPKQLGMSDEQRRALLSDRYGVESSGDLTVPQLRDLCAHFEALGVEFPRKGKSSDRKRARFYEITDGTPYAAQKRKIAAMWHALGWKLAGLDVRCRKQFGVERFVWLNDQGALQTLAKDLINRCNAKGIDPDNAEPAG